LRARSQSRYSGAMVWSWVSSERGGGECSRRPGRDPNRADSSGTALAVFPGFAPGIDVNAT